MSYGVVTYDIPKHRKSAYSKVRNKIRRKTIMQTWSAYLFPWGLYDEIKKIFENLNKDETGSLLPKRDLIRFSIFKYDSEVSGPDLLQSAKDAMVKMIGTAKQAINQMLYELHADVEVEFSDKVKSAYNAIGRAKKVKEDIEALVVIFNLTDDLKAGILAFQGYIIAKRKEIENLEAVVEAAGTLPGRLPHATASMLAPELDDVEAGDGEIPVDQLHPTVVAK